MQISIRELKANPGRAITLMQQGEQVQITSHRKVVAELVAPRPSAVASQAVDDAQAMARLLASGLVAQVATKPLALPRAIRLPRSPDGKSLSDLVIEGRGPG